MSSLLNERTHFLDLLEIHAATKNSGTEIFTLRGDIDMSNARDAQELILRETNNAAHDIICDLSGIDFIDSAGLRALIALQHQAIKHGSMLCIMLGDNYRVKRLLDISGLDRVFTLVA